MKEKTKAWGFLILAIFAEVLGTSSLHLFSEHLWLKYSLMGIFITLSYIFMSFSLKAISISIAYAMWEVLGIILITLIGFVFFNEVLSLYQKLGILLGTIGIILINMEE